MQRLTAQIVAECATGNLGWRKKRSLSREGSLTGQSDQSVLAMLKKGANGSQEPSKPENKKARAASTKASEDSSSSSSES